MLLKPGMKHQGEDLNKVYINHDAVTTWAKSVAHAFEWEKIVKMSFEGKLKGNWKMDGIFMMLKKL